MLKYSKLMNDSWLRWSADSVEKAKLCIMGVPFDNAVSLGRGAAKGPETIRNPVSYTHLKKARRASQFSKR